MALNKQMQVNLNISHMVSKFEHQPDSWQSKQTTSLPKNKQKNNSPLLQSTYSVLRTNLLEFRISPQPAWWYGVRVHFQFTWVEQNVPNCRATTPIHFFLSSVVKKFFQMRIGRVRHLHFHPRNSSNSVFFSTESSILSLPYFLCWNSNYQKSSLNKLTNANASLSL